MTLRIERTDTPTAQDREAILVPLRASNTATTGGTVPELVALLVRYEHRGETVGGLYGRVCFRWFYIELPLVPEQDRPAECRDGRGLQGRVESGSCLIFKTR